MFSFLSSSLHDARWKSGYRHHNRWMVARRQLRKYLDSVRDNIRVFIFTRSLPVFACGYTRLVVNHPSVPFLLPSLTLDRPIAPSALIYTQVLKALPDDLAEGLEVDIGESETREHDA